MSVSIELMLEYFFLLTYLSPSKRVFTIVTGKQFLMTMSVYCFKRTQKTKVHQTPWLSLFQAKITPDTFLRFM